MRRATNFLPHYYQRAPIENRKCILKKEPDIPVRTRSYNSRIAESSLFFSLSRRTGRSPNAVSLSVASWYYAHTLFFSFEISITQTPFRNHFRISAELERGFLYVSNRVYLHTLHTHHILTSNNVCALTISLTIFNDDRNNNISLLHAFSNVQQTAIVYYLSHLR